MRYRRLGRTEALVSEVGLTGRALQDAPREVAAETLRAAFADGVSLVALDTRDDLPDLEQLVGEVAGSDRPRLTIVTVLPTLPPAEDLAPAIEAAALRLGPGGYLDVIGLPGELSPEHVQALQEVRARGTLRHAGVATSDAAAAIAALEAGWAEVLIAPLNVPERLQMRPAIEAARAVGAGVVLAGRVGSGRTLDLAPVAAELGEVGGSPERAGRALVAWGLNEPGVHAVAAGARTPEEFETLVSASRMEFHVAMALRLEAATKAATGA